MSKEVLLIFQDCPYCEPRTEWGKRQMKIAADHGIKVVETHFTSVGAKGLIIAAKNRGVDHMPFFTDGEKFSYDLSDFVKGVKRTQAIKVDQADTDEQSVQVARSYKKTKTAAKVKEIVEDESSAED